MLLPLGAAAAIAGSLGYAFWRKAPLSMTTTIAVIAVFALTLIPGTSGDRDLVGPLLPRGMGDRRVDGERR